MAIEDERVLILCKTYPSPSGKYVETSCVAGLRSDGRLIRLYPVPFRLIQDDKKFKKWQWIDAKIAKAKDDHRPESHRLLIDTINCERDPIPTSNKWRQRREALSRTSIFEDFSAIEQERKDIQTTLALLRPRRILSLEIEPAKNPDWTSDELAKLVQMQQQLDLFNSQDKVAISTLKKLPFSFYYNYECLDVNGEIRKYRHKIVDWEIGALYWRCVQSYGEDWEAKFRQKVGVQLPNSDLIFLMGTIHRFPDQWLIVSLIYPPKIPEILEQPPLL